MANNSILIGAPLTISWGDFSLLAGVLQISSDNDGNQVILNCGGTPVGDLISPLTGFVGLCDYMNATEPRHPNPVWSFDVGNNRLLVTSILEGGLSYVSEALSYSPDLAATLKLTVASGAVIVQAKDDPPVSDVPSGIYAVSQTVTLSGNPPGTDIYYSIDETPPSLLYSGPIVVSESQTITAVVRAYNAIRGTSVDSEPLVLEIVIREGTQRHFLIASYLKKLTLYSVSGSVEFDFLNSSDGITVEDGDFNTATVMQVQGMVLDEDGTIYFIDTPDPGLGGGDTLIRKMVFLSDTTGTIETIPVTPPIEKDVAPLKEVGITIDDSYIYTSDMVYSVIWRTPKAGGQRELFAGTVFNLPLGTPMGMCRINTDLYVADDGQGSVFKINSGGIVSTLANKDNFHDVFSCIDVFGTVYALPQDKSSHYFGLSKTLLSGVTTMIYPQDGSLADTTSYQALSRARGEDHIYEADVQNNLINVFDLEGALGTPISLAIPAPSYSPSNILVIGPGVIPEPNPEPPSPLSYKASDNPATSKLFVDLSIDEQVIFQGVPALNAVPLNPSIHAGLEGTLMFGDNQGTEDPFSEGLGSRFSLLYFKDNVNPGVSIPLQPIPSQQFNITLNGQNCTVSIYHKEDL
jgi:hypothetical protein